VSFFLLEIECPSPMLKANSKVDTPKPKYEYQDKITVVCDTGYTLKGNNELSCQADTNWGPLIPDCQSGY